MSQAAQTSVGGAAKAAERFYLPELDVLRFFAFFGVFLYHALPLVVIPYQSQAWPYTLNNAGAFGVDLFFTISGYLITKLLLRERDETGEINLRAFYARRTLRIWPLYYFSIGLAYLLSQLPRYLTSAPIIGDVFPPTGANAYFFMAIFLFNFNFYSSLLTNPMPFMGHLWTISVEEQFYAVWPWFVRYVPRRRIVVLPLIMIAIGCIVRASLTFNLSRLVWNYTFAHFDSIAVGILVAMMPRLDIGAATRLLLVLVGIASWVFAACWCGLPSQDRALYISMGYPAIAIGSGAFLLAAMGAKSLRTDAAPLKLLIELGKISYGLYVYSVIAYSIARLLLFRGTLGAILPEIGRWWTQPALYLLVAFALNVAMAAASYRWLESPFLRLKERFARIPTRAV